MALGGNQPWNGMDPREVLEAALARFPAVGLTVVKRSAWWRSQAWPDPNQPEFVNGVAIVETALAAHDLMPTLLALEREFGRERGIANAPRTLDLDLIAFGRERIDQPSLRLPHPHAAERRFVMGPLAEIAPAWVHPLSGRAAASLAASTTVGADAAPEAPPS